MYYYLVFFMFIMLAFDLSIQIHCAVPTVQISGSSPYGINQLVDAFANKDL